MKIKVNALKSLFVQRFVIVGLVVALSIFTSGCGWYQRLKFNWDYINIFTRSEKTSIKVKSNAEAIKNVFSNRDCYALEFKKEYLDLSADELLRGIILFLEEYGTFSEHTLNYEFTCGTISLEEQGEENILIITDQLTEPSKTFTFRIIHNKLAKEADELSLNNLRRFYALLQELKMSQ